MVTTTFSSREFNQETGRAKTAARQGPVIITDRGEPSHVLLTMADYRRLTAPQMSLAEAVSQTTDFDFEPPRLTSMGFRAADFD